jgi:hypothetical protein
VKWVSLNEGDEVMWQLQNRDFTKRSCHLAIKRRDFKYGGGEALIP